jgi:dipeptidyl aminopeptidase/acylaminoacyl peptidase
MLALVCLTVPTSPATATFDGENGRIAFRRFLDLDQTTGAIFTVRPDGSGERQVTHPEAGVVDRNPDVSPDGRRIVFQRDGETMSDIFVVNRDGTRLRQLTSTADGTPAWLPNGRRIVFSRAFGPVENDLVETPGAVRDAVRRHARAPAHPAEPTGDGRDGGGLRAAVLTRRYPGGLPASQRSHGPTQRRRRPVDPRFVHWC